MSSSAQVYGPDRTLYVIRFQDQQSAEPRELTPFERLEGWREGKTWGGKPLVVNERHQAGALHTRTGPFILSWDVQPGETVALRLRVTFTYELSPCGEGPDGSPRYTLAPVSASCTPTAYSPHGEYAVMLGTVLGRSVMLGEDGAEAAFGHDCLREMLEHTLEGDDRRTQCDCQLVLWPDADPASPEFAAWLKLAECVEVRRTEEVARG